MGGETRSSRDCEREPQRRETARAYDSAAAYTSKRFQHERRGCEPVVATQRAKPEMTDAQLEALFPPGTVGGPNGVVVSGSQVFR